MISPVLPRPTASGFTMPSVRDTATLLSSWGRRLESLPEQRYHVDRAAHDRDVGLLEGGELFFGGARRPGDDGSGVAHAAPLGSGLPRDEPDHRFSYLVTDKLRRPLLVGAADFADHHD